MHRGEVRWYRFAKPDKRRPVVILTRDSAVEFLGEVTIAPITSRIREIPTEIVLGPEEGLRRECAVNADHIQTVSRGKIGPLISRLDETKMEALRRAILFAFGYRSRMESEGRSRSA